MAGPWEKYQSAAPAAAPAGPWAAYMTPEQFAQTKAEGQAVPGNVPAKIGVEGFGDAMRSVVKETPWAARNMAAAGTRVSNLAEGVKQPFGASDPAAVQGYRVLEKEAPVGAVGGNIAMLAPTAMIPGANTVAGAGIVSGIAGALEPTIGDESRLQNGVTAGVLGAAGQKAGGLLGDFVQGRKATQAAELASKQSQNSVRDTTLKTAQDAGYVVPPSAAGGGWLTKRLESISGKAAIGQEAAVKNQTVTDSLARKAAGLHQDQAITESTLSAARDRIAAPYREAAAIDPTVKADIEAMKQARFDAKQNYKFYAHNPDPEILKKAQAFESSAAQIEQYIEQAAQNAGKTDLVKRLREARQQLAKNYEVERALNLGSGQVDASVLGRSLDRGSPMTGDLATIAKFQQAFPAYAREGGRVPTPGVSKSEAILAGLAGGGGAAAFGPVGMLAAALPLASSPVRAGLLSGPGQAMFARPSYTPGLLSRAAGNIMTPEALGVAARGGLLTAQ